MSMYAAKCICPPPYEEGNNLHQNIKSTMEEESNGELPLITN